jgi:Glycosyl hydrolase family 79 C-terminal beta domain
VSPLLLLFSRHIATAEAYHTHSYYTFLILATALSNLPTPYITALASPPSLPNLAIYALYPFSPTSSPHPTKLIILNLSFRAANSTTPRPEGHVSVSGILGTNKVSVTRFTAAGADSTAQATFGGQDWLSAGTGAPVGRKVVEMVDDGVVSVGDSEGVLVEARWPLVRGRRG